MDRTVLKRFLDEGLALAEIGRRVDRHESTVAYWVKQYGFEAVNRDKHASRGGIRKEELEPLVDAGLSAAQIAGRLGLSKTTVRHWLKEYGISTQWALRRHASTAGQPSLELVCPHHGPATFRRRNEGGYRCTRCRAEAVSRRRRKVKRLLMEEAGGCCAVCGYDRCAAALEFHHLVPADKRFSLSHRGVARSLEKARAEASKCVLLCGNCHSEVEAGMIKLALPDLADYNGARTRPHAG